MLLRMTIVIKIVVNIIKSFKSSKNSLDETTNEKLHLTVEFNCDSRTFYKNM